ncbi:UNVERIFIED_CONTAM: hypothetical protein FKN15_067939 [Acipenser sinensis]
MDLLEMIEQITRNALAQREQLERWEREMGLAPVKKREPTELELLLQEWEQASGAPQPPEPEGEEPSLPEPREEELPLPEPRGEEPLLPEPRGEEPLLLEPRGEEPLLPEPRGEEPLLLEPRGEEPLLLEPRGEEPLLLEPRGEEPLLLEPRGEEPLLLEPRGEEPLLPEPRGEEPPLPEPREEVTSVPPPQPRPPPLRSSPASLRPVPHPLLLDTLSVSLDLPSLDLEPRSRQDRAQFSTWSPAPLLPDTKTSLRCSQTSRTLPLVTTSLPLADRTSLHWVPAADLCPLLQPPVPRLSCRSPLTNRWGPSSPVRGPYLADPGRGPIHPRVRPWKRAKIDIYGLEGPIDTLFIGIFDFCFNPVIETRAAMLTLASKLKRDDAVKSGHSNSAATDSARRVSIRDRLLVKEVAELEENLPNTCKVNFPDVNKLHHFQLDVTPDTCKVNFPDVNKLHHFQLDVTPDEGYYQSGKFQFEVDVPEAYNMVPPKVKCLTRIWHPNITETGEICLSLLREHSIDCTGWAPTRTLKDVVWGLNSLFTDLLNFDDPLNIEAAEHHLRDKFGTPPVAAVNFTAGIEKDLRKSGNACAKLVLMVLVEIIVINVIHHKPVTVIARQREEGCSGA